MDEFFKRYAKYEVEMDGVKVAVEAKRKANFASIRLASGDDEYYLHIYDDGDIKMWRRVVREEEVKPIEKS